jgi:hypothetical protein
VAGPGRDGQRQPERSERCQRALQWRQSGPLSLAVTALAQPGRGHRGRDGRRRHTDGCGVQIVDANAGLIAVACALAPVLGHAQGSQARRQPIIGAIAWPDLVVPRATERVLRRGAPRLNAREPMVTFGEKKGEPANQPLPQAQARPRAMGREGGVDPCGHTHLQ